MCLSLRPLLNVFQQTLTMNNSHDEDSLTPYLVYKTITINKPFSDILIADFRHNSSNEGEFFDISRCHKNP